MSPSITDVFHRPLTDLRISVTDRCNFRCTYCMPKEVFGRDFVFLPKSELLTFAEITRLATVAVARGVRKIRLTGGEPLLRKDIEELVRSLSTLRAPDGKPIDLAMTTNGSVLAQKAESLRAAGLNRVTVSLDALSDETFQAMNDVSYPVAKVLSAIDVAQRAGLGPVKINTVVKRGSNDGEILAMARHFRGTPFILRFIEYMDVGASNGWRMDEVVPSAEILATIDAVFPLEQVPASVPGETSQRWRYRDGGGEIGVISSVTQAFCSGCTRARLSADGKLFTCLFATAGSDLRALLREGASDAELGEALTGIWTVRRDRYSEVRGAAQGAAGRGNSDDSAPKTPQRIEMSYIGG